MSSSLGAVGRLRVIEVLNRRFGRTLVDTHNLVVDLGLSAITRLIGGGYGAPSIDIYPLATLSGAAVGSMWLGMRDPAPAPVAGDTALIPNVDVPNAGGFLGKFTTAGSTLSVSYPAADTVRFSATVAAGKWDVPRDPITEEMLITELGTVFARVALPLPVNTTPSSGLAFVHDITLARI